MYDPAAIPTPAAPPDSFVNMPGHYVKRAHGNNPDIFMQHQPTPEQARAAIAAYYACVSFVDDNVGRILHTLDPSGLASNTVVIFLGDHGFHLGDHGFWSKYSMLEPTRKVALIVRVPGAPANGRVCREFVEFVDLVPTLGALVKLSAARESRGDELRSAPGRPRAPWKKAVFMVGGSMDQGQVVRTRRYSYLEYRNGADSRPCSTWRRIPGRRTTSPINPRMPKRGGRWRACSRPDGRRPCPMACSPSTVARTTGSLAERNRPPSGAPFPPPTELSHADTLDRRLTTRLQRRLGHARRWQQPRGSTRGCGCSARRSTTPWPRSSMTWRPGASTARSCW